MDELLTAAKFQSTLPAWGETVDSNGQKRKIRISIHSPRMGRDGFPHSPLALPGDFNPLSPHGERRESYVWRGGK